MNNIQIQKSRSQKNHFHQTSSTSRHLQKERLVKATFWLDSRVKRHIQRRADDSRLSFSSVGAMICRQWAEADISKQNQDLLELKLRQMIREEIRASDNRKIFFHMRSAYAIEQARILMTNALKMIMTQLLKLPRESFQRLLDESARMARRNIIQKSPQMKALLDEFEAQNHTEGTNKN